MPECYADTLMVRTFVPPKIRYNHQRSCTKVQGQMIINNNGIKGDLYDKFAVGIIDNDKREIAYLKEFVSSFDFLFSKPIAAYFNKLVMDVLVRACRL